MTSFPLRLMADDLTGALDTAAEFVGLVGPVQTYWHGVAPAMLPAVAALDTGTREASRADAQEIVARLASLMDKAAISFKKVDSLLRGQSIAELATCFHNGGWTHAVFAPAFPYQGRVTRAGTQHSRDALGLWVAVGTDLVAALRAEGVPAHAAQPGSGVLPGITVFDAETDADLDAAVAAGQAVSTPVLWCGSGGLAHALARHHGKATVDERRLQGPILGLFGSDQVTTATQLAACAPHWLALPDGGRTSAAQIMGRCAQNGIALASFALPVGLDRASAALRIGAEMGELVSRLDPPGTLIVAGGETLRSLCITLEATSLEVQGRFEPGLPRSILRGGRWDGVVVISKSGAFGHPGLLRDLLNAAGSAATPSLERPA